MPRLHLTDLAVRNLKPPATGQLIYTDHLFRENGGSMITDKGARLGAFSVDVVDECPGARPIWRSRWQGD